MNDEKKRTIKTIMIPFVFLALFVLILIVIFFNGHETYTSTDPEDNIVTAIKCVTGGVDGSFFSPSTANTIENQVKISFSNDKPDQFFYFFEGVYRDKSVAEQENAVFHAKYNKYLGAKSIDHESFTPTFSTVETKMRINLYAKDRDMINRITAVLFFIDSDGYEGFLGYSSEQVTNYYEKQGFSCEKQN